ncbi:MAG: hypothetical protein M1831_005444 [Alyxoria varia]|nr:MAG: hypothetical protein M1831_005444 [Alyxoria varia]
MDLLDVVQKLSFAPPVFHPDFISKLGEKVVLPDASFPKPTHNSNAVDSKGGAVPQAIAHRGHTAKYPENTIEAFKGAVHAGAHAVETDVRLTKDGVVVLSHDSNLKRCYGKDKQIKDCTWDELKTFYTIQEPHSPLTRLQDLLELFQRPHWRNIWILVDVKIDSDSEELMQRVASTFRRVDPGHGSRWQDKAKFIPLCSQYFPGFAITNIGFSTAYSSQIFDVTDTGFTVAQATIVSPSGRRFIQKAHRQDRSVYCWTVNDKKSMDWCVKNKLEGVVTDDIPSFLSFCETYNEEASHQWPRKLLLWLLYFNFWIFIFGIAFRQRYGSCIKTGATSKAEKKWV